MRSKVPLAVAAAAIVAVMGLSVAARPAGAPGVSKGVSPQRQSISALAIAISPSSEGEVP